MVALIGCVGVITGVPAALTVGGVQIFLSYANQYTKPFNEVTNVITQIQRRMPRRAECLHCSTHASKSPMRRMPLNLPPRR